MASKLPRPRLTLAESDDASSLLDQHAALLSALHYPAEDAARLKNGQAWVEESEAARELVDWTREAFASAMEEISVEQEERELFDAALRYKLVKPVPSRAGPASDDIEPATLLFPPDYHTRSELRKIQEQNEASRQLLHKHSALNAERHAQLSSQLAALTKRISESQSLLDNLDPIMAAADADVTDSTQLLKSSINEAAQRLRQGSLLVLPHPTSSPQSLTSHTQTILSLSSDLSSLLSSLASLNPITSSFQLPLLDEPELESLAKLVAQLETGIRSPTGEGAESLALDDMASLSVEELRGILDQERDELSLAERDLGSVPSMREARIREEVDTARREHHLAELQRSARALSEMKAYLERELAILISAHNALAETLEASSEVNAFAKALLHLLHELSSPPPSPSPPALSRRKDTQPERDLLRAVASLSRTPLLNRQDIRSSIEGVEDAFASRLSRDQATIAADSSLQSLLRAHLHLYSPTQVLHPTSPALETLLGKAVLREQEAKAALSSVAAREAELSPTERDSLKRLQMLVDFPQGQPNISPPRADYLPLSALDPELGENEGHLTTLTRGLHLSRSHSLLAILRRHAHPLLVTFAAFVLLGLLFWPPGRWEGWREGLTLEYPAVKAPSSVEELRALVGRDAKFLAKQSGASYGYNNVRYMLETTLLWAKLLDRVPVIPAAIWARSCAVDSETCTKHSLEHFVDRNAPEHHLDVTWNEDGEIWKLAIEEFLDLPHLRATYGPVLTLEEFYTLNGLNKSLMHISGHIQHALPELVSPLTIAISSNDEFEPPHAVRIDAVPRRTQAEEGRIREALSEKVRGSMDGRKVWTEEQARRAIEEAGEFVGEGEDALVLAAKYAGLVPVYTFSDEVIMNKALATPSTEFTPFSSLLSFSTFSTTEPYSSASLLFFPGAYHDQRKPGTIRFGTPEARDDFARLGTEGIRPPAGIVRLGEVLSARMEELCGGRKWVAAHMRRGDFIGIGWSPDKDPKVHFAKTRRALNEGIDELAHHFPADSLPLSSDPFYLATDEQDPTALAFYRASDALLLSDLMTRADAQSLGWQASFTDLLALVEQQVLAGADFFVGSEMSSTSGGAINYRMARGKERWSWKLLGTDP